jgi:hypothetical protein
VKNLVAIWLREHAIDVAKVSACILAERIRDDLLSMSGTEMHTELSVAVFDALRVYFETFEFKIPDPSVN